MSLNLANQQELASQWFQKLRDDICDEFVAIEKEAGFSSIFNKTPWNREEGKGGGGLISLMKGEVFEKVGVNFSEVHGTFEADLVGVKGGTKFWAAGVSVVAHMLSPLIPTVHMNTRFICTENDSAFKQWFGGGADLTPTFPFDEDTALFHSTLKTACDKFSPTYYPKYKADCDNYFYIPIRKEHRGVGGIFCDYLDTGNWEEDFAFIQEIGKAFLDCYPQIVRRHYKKSWSAEEKEAQLYKRGRYVEFNLIYDKGTHFGFKTGGNTEAILMSMPPTVKW